MVITSLDNIDCTIESIRWRNKKDESKLEKKKSAIEPTNQLCHIKTACTETTERTAHS